MAGIKKRRVLLFGLAGAAIGYLVLHPYSMLVYLLHREHEAMERGIDLSTAVHDALLAFSRGMLHMGIPYALLGAAAGFFDGAIDEVRSRMRIPARTRRRSCRASASVCAYW